MGKYMIFNINLEKNKLNIKKTITSQENIENSVSCNLLNNFIQTLNQNSNQYNDNTIIEYLQRRLLFSL
jgi:hypothetical protein